MSHCCKRLGYLHLPNIQDQGCYNHNFKVIIVGGPVAGLTLAHCLSKAGIDYVVLEKHSKFAPQEEASIGIMPHGGRILEQLGIFDTIESLIEPLHISHINYPDGFEHTNRAPRVLSKRFGFPLAFLERQKSLQVLFESLTDRSKILVNKSVVSEDQKDASSTTVCSEDGHVYTGDLVVGADGVHSRVRSELWRLARNGKAGTVEEGVKIEYACVFGASSEVPGLHPGEQVTSLNDGISFMIFPGKHGFTTPDAIRTREEYAGNRIWKEVQFCDIWIRKQAFSMVNLEENVFETWTWVRVVCIADSMHKLLGRYHLLYSNDLPADTASKIIAGAGFLDFLPISNRPGHGWERFKFRQPRTAYYVEFVRFIALVFKFAMWMGKLQSL